MIRIIRLMHWNSYREGKPFGESAPGFNKSLDFTEGRLKTLFVLLLYDEKQPSEERCDPGWEGEPDEMAKRIEQPESQENWSLNDIKNLIKIINENQLKEFDLELGPMKLRVITQYHTHPQPEGHSTAHMPPYFQPAFMTQMTGQLPPSQMEPAPPPPPLAKTDKPAASEVKPVEDKNIVEVKSPMVGTFYRAPSPESPPYVEVGDTVTPETVLCIVEAMKLMNEIKAEMRGAVLEVLVENGQPVEYGQPMFRIRKSG